MGSGRPRLPVLRVKDANAIPASKVDVEAARCDLRALRATQMAAPCPVIQGQLHLEMSGEGAGRERGAKQGLILSWYVNFAGPAFSVS
jgi:hypothetical protein